jgi:LDH2 family malate/lactate/ureidoglycolate dehydrogenase
MTETYKVTEIRAFAAAVLAKAGVPPEPAVAVAEGLVEADLYGHVTHGLALLPDYVEEIENGTMALAGRPDVLSDFGAVALWDAKRLPGVWTTKLAIVEAASRAGRFGVGAVAVRRSHHIACLAAFLEEPARAGKLVLLFSSDPSDAHVAPFGGVTPVMTPNPLAVGIPASPEPILIDVSTSITTAAMCARARADGRPLPGKWVLDGQGRATDDAQVMKEGGSILPIGGLDHGHKGYALGLMVEALTQGLSGFGRAERPTEWGAAVLALVFEPVAFGGIDAFMHETSWLGELCRASAVPAGAPPVRLPGATALARKAEAVANGLALDERRLSGLRALAARVSVEMPRAISRN